MDVIFDVDGTLADCEHRRHYVQSKPKNWTAFMKAAKRDTPIEPLACLARSLVTMAHRVILCSGRNEAYRSLTEAWMKQHQIGYHGLYMRADGDSRRDDIVKEELLDRIIVDGFRPQLIFDDRQQVVDTWRRRGLVCCQVAEGNF